MSRRINLTVLQNSDFEHTFTYNDETGEPIDVSGHSANSAYKKSHHKSKANTVVFDEITLSNGEIYVALTVNTTANMSGSYVYDVVVSNGSFVERVYEGYINIAPGIAKL